QPGHATVERRVASGGGVRLRVVLRVDVVPTEPELVIAAKDAQFVRDLVDQGRRGRRQTRRHGEAARNTQAQVFRQHRRRLDADVVVVQQRNVLFGVRASIDRYAERVDCGVADEELVTQDA